MQFAKFYTSFVIVVLISVSSYAQLADDCAGAATRLYDLTVAGDYTNMSLTIPAGQGVSPNPPTCSPVLPAIIQDSWFKMRASATGLLLVSFTPMVAQNIALSVYRNNCAALPLLQCANKYGMGKHTESALISAVANTDYLVRVINLTAGGTYTGNLSIYQGPSPARDLCISAVPVSIGTCNFDLDVSAGYPHNESYTGTVGCGTNQTIRQDSWAKIDLTTGRRIRIRYTNTTKDAAILVYSGADCGNLLQEICQNSKAGLGTEDLEFQATATGTYYIRFVNVIDEATLEGNLCIEEVFYRDDDANVLLVTFPSLVKVGDCGVRVAIKETDTNGDNTACNAGPGNNVWMKYTATAADNGKNLRAEFNSSNDVNVGMAVVTTPAWTSLSPDACVAASASVYVGTNFTAVAGITYYIELVRGGLGDVEGSFCLYEDAKRAEDYFYTSRTFETNGADCGKIFNVYKGFEDDGGTPTGVGAAINTPGCTSTNSVLDAWGNFQVSAIPVGGYILEYNNDDGNVNTTAPDAAMQVWLGGTVQTAATISNTTMNLACSGGTSINTNMIATSVNANGTVVDGTSIVPTPACLGVLTMNSDVWVKYTSTSNQNFRVVFRDNGIATLLPANPSNLIQVYTSTGTCVAPTLTVVGCSRKGTDLFHPDVTTVLVTNAAAGVVYYMRIVTLGTTNTGYTQQGELSVSDPTQLTAIACNNTVIEGVESITLNTGAPAAFVTNRQYYFRVAGTTTNTMQGRMCIRNNAIPSGDLCSNAIPLIVGDCDINFDLTAAFTNNQIVADATPGSCFLPAANAWRDGWISFTAKSSTTSVEFIQVASATQDVQIEVFKGSCGSLIRVPVLNTLNYCVNNVLVNTAGEEKYQFASVIGAIYYVRVINRFANDLDSKLCIYNTVERDVCDDNDLDTRFVGECNLFFDVSDSFDDPPFPAAIDPLFRDFIAGEALPVLETGGSLNQFVTSSCENPFSLVADNNPGITNIRDAWVRIIGNGNDVTIIYETTGSNTPNPALAVYTALKSTGPVNCGTGLNGANNPANQYACANNVLTNAQQSESVTFKSNAGQQYLLRIINLNPSGTTSSTTGMTGILCISDGKNNYSEPCVASVNGPRRVEIGKCSIPLNIATGTASCYDPANANAQYNNTAGASTCDDCISKESWSVVTRPFVCDPLLAPPLPTSNGGNISCPVPYRVNLGTDGAIGGLGAAADKCECGQATTNICALPVPTPVVLSNTVGVCPAPYSYNRNGTAGTADDFCSCSQQSIRPGTSSGSFTVDYDNRNGTSAIAPNINMVVYRTTNCNDENAYTRQGTCQNTPTGENIRTLTISALPTTHGSGGEEFLIRVLNQSTTKTVFGTLCLYYGTSLAGGPDCPSATNNDYGELEGDFRNFNVLDDGTAPPTGESLPTTTIASCVVAGATYPVSSDATTPIRSDAWMKFVVPAGSTYGKVTIQYDNDLVASPLNAAVAVYTAPNHPQGADGIGLEPNCNTYDAITEPNGLFLMDCSNTVFRGSESMTVPITFSGGAQPSATPTSIARTYYVRVMNIHNTGGSAGTMTGRIRIFPFAECNLGSELVTDGNFSAWPTINYTAGTPNNITDTQVNYDAKRTGGVYTAPVVAADMTYPTPLDGVFGSAINTGVSQFATDYGYARDAVSPTTNTGIAVAERPYRNVYADLINTQLELSPQGLYTIRQASWGAHLKFHAFGVGYSGYGGLQTATGSGSLNSTTAYPTNVYCLTGGGVGSEPCQSIPLGSSNFNTIGAYNTALGGTGRTAGWPSVADANFMAVNGSYNSNSALPEGKVWCQTIKRAAADVSDVSYYVFSLWTQNLMSVGINWDLPLLRLTVCDMEDPTTGNLPTERDLYSNANGDTGLPDETRMSRLPGITDTGLTNAQLFGEELAVAGTNKQQVRHLPRPSTKRIRAIVNGISPSYGAAMPCNLSIGNSYIGADNVAEGTNARVKTLGSSLVVPEGPDNWVAIRCIYRAPRNVSEMNICIENLSLTEIGNNFGIDQLSFRKCESADAETFDKLLKGDACEISSDGKAIGIPLTAHLIEFSATLLGDRVGLNWTTIGEDDASHYQVQRSTDGKHFSILGLVDAKGTQGGAADYAYIDNNLPYGIKYLYYRLNIVNKKGIEQMGSVVMVEIDQQADFALKLKPNPTQKGNEVTLTFHNIQAGKALIQVTDLVGTPIIRQIRDAKEGENEMNLSTAGLKSGLYIVRLVLNGKVATKKLVVR